MNFCPEIGKNRTKIHESAIVVVGNKVKTEKMKGHDKNSIKSKKMIC